MNPEDTYVNDVIFRHRNFTSDVQVQAVIAVLRPHIVAWANGYLVEIIPSGSIAKGTAILGSSDVDILVSTHHTLSASLKDIYETLFQRLAMAGFNPRLQNVSLGIELNGLKIDIVPARKQSALTNNHSIWSHKKQSHRQTNIHEHVRIVTSSGRLNEIRALKIWKKLHGLTFPSFLGEMIVIQALSGCSLNTPSANFLRVLRYIRDNIITLRIVDPANSNNVITDDLDYAERVALRDKAIQSLAQQSWGNIIW